MAGGCYTLTPGGEAFRFRATTLGTYLIIDRDQRLLAADGSRATQPAPSTEWRARLTRDRMSFTSQGTTLRLAGNDAFRVRAASGCPAFEEAQVNVSGRPHAGVSPYQEVRGYVDAHTHGMAFEFLGGAVHCGKPWDKYGPAYALVDCPDHSSTNGYGAALGVRQMELVNKFDNALSGIAGDSGETGVVVNAANFLETGSYWDMRHCEPADGESADKAQLGVPDISAGQQDALFAAVGQVGGLLNLGALPLYGTPMHCNSRGLTDLGAHLVDRLADRHLLIDPDHMSVKARNSLLDQLEARAYSGAISSHSWSTPDAYPRIYRLGGYVAPYAGDSTGFVQKWRRHLGWADERFYFVGLLPQPRPPEVPECLRPARTRRYVDEAAAPHRRPALPAAGDHLHLLREGWESPRTDQCRRESYRAVGWSRTRAWPGVELGLGNRLRADTPARASPREKRSLHPMQIVAIVVSFALTIAALALLVPAVRKMLGVIRSGQPAPGRTDNPVGRGVTMLKETFLHTRMLQWHWVGIMHWFIYMAFLVLSTAVLAAYFQLFKPDFAYPVIGHWYPFEWFMEIIGALSTIGIVFLIIYRQKHHPRSEGRGSRFFGSTFWQAYFVEALALFEGAAILFVRAAEWKLDDEGDRLHYPFSSWIGDALYSSFSSDAAFENIIYAIATFKIALAMVWLMVIARNITMGIAWHRFTVWFNIFYKRESDGNTALGAMKPLTSGGKTVTLDDLDDLDEESILGVGSIEDFSWKGLLDFTTCTECGRCQSQCPAWNTEKPLSPKLLIMGLRDHAYAKAEDVESHSERALVGSGTKGESGGTGTDVLDYFYNPEDAPFVIDEDVLWSCTSCGACVQQCPVDIEHVDHIMDMRRYQVLVESNFPAELNGLFKGLENKGNPWNMSSTARMDWAKGLEFDVPVVGEDLESLESVDWLFWVGCAGAYEDRAKKTTRAVAELLNMAGVSFGVLGNGETCTGDPARRAGNEFVFQGLAAQNVETFKEFKVKKVVSTCAHCFNTLKNEYKDFGIELEVVHHTQLLNRLVREGKLTPVKDGAGAAKRSITYHDPCYLGRHNDVYTPPRELLEILPGAEFTEMERNSEKSFCCGAGGARMWMEENIGERINLNRTKEAVGTGADQIAVGCPFCRVMLSDGLTAEQAAGNAREEVEVLDVAQMLLASVKGESATKAPAMAAAGTPKAAAASTDVATKAEPEAGDVTVTEDTVTETADAGPAAKASGGSSLFDTPASEPTEKAAPAANASGGSSLFDTPAPEKAAPAANASGGSSLFDTPAPAPAEAEPTETEPEDAEPAESVAADSTPAKPAADLGSGGSLFDLAEPEPAPKQAATAAVEPTSASPAAKPEATSAPVAKPAAATGSPAGSTGSLFDIAAPDPAPAPSQAAPRAEAKVEAPSGAVSTPATSIPEGGSLFDLEAPQAVATSAPPAEPAPAVVDDRDVPEEPATQPPAPTSSGPVSTPATSIPEGGSLFDIEAPAPSAPAPPAATPAARTETEPADQPTAPAAPADQPTAPADETPAADEASTLSGGAALSQAATFAPAEDEAAESAEPETSEPETDGPAEEAPEETAEAEGESAQPTPAPAPTNNAQQAPRGDVHTPKTDVDISGSGSLFDL